MYAILLAGGHGTRLWPVSRKSVPKQLQPILGKETLLQATWKRLRKELPASKILVVTSSAQAKLVGRDLKELPLENLLVEPFRRDTAAAIGFGTLVVSLRDPQATVVTINSDAFVKDVKAYWRVLKSAERIARKTKNVVLVGLQPKYPETGYGYIKTGRRLSGSKKERVLHVDGFREKPNLATAKSYLKNGRYLWNPALIVANVEVLLSAYQNYLPALRSELEAIRISWHTPARQRQLQQSFKNTQPISIDYGILEKLKNMLVIPADFGWADVGHWRAVHEVLAPHVKANLSRSRHVGVDSEGNVLYSFTGKLIATAGLKDMIVVETKDAILICPKDRAQDVKKIVEQLGKQHMKKYL